MILSARAQLEDLLVALFTARELRRELVRWAEDLEPVLPSDTLPPAELAHAAVDALVRRGLDGPQLFEQLVHLRRWREPEIRRVQQLWSPHDRRRFVVVYETDQPESSAPEVFDALFEARIRSGDPTLRVVKIYRGSACCLFEAREATASLPLSAWFPLPARLAPELSAGPPILASRAALQRAALERTEGAGHWSALDLAELDRLWGAGDGLEFRRDALSPLESDALERALRLAQLLVALPPPPNLEIAELLLRDVLDLGGAMQIAGSLIVSVRESWYLDLLEFDPRLHRTVREIYRRYDLMRRGWHPTELRSTAEWFWSIVRDNQVRLPQWSSPQSYRRPAGDG